MRKWTMVATWRMALEGLVAAGQALDQGAPIGDSLVRAVSLVEDNPNFKSVGYGGLPNEEGQVELDAGYMDGTTFDVGAVMGLEGIRNPIQVAQSLSKEALNNVLVGTGARQYALQAGFRPSNLLTPKALEHYQKHQAKLASNQEIYRGHDTVGMIGLDHEGHMAAATSTSGLFLKKKGRIGDSPLIGSGFYADSQIGAATATGLGEDLMRGVVAYDIVRLMAEGVKPQAACQRVVNQLESRLKSSGRTVGDLSVIALDKTGQVGCATNIKDFSFVVARAGEAPKVFVANRDSKGDTQYALATQDWLDAYMAKRS